MEIKDFFKEVKMYARSGTDQRIAKVAIKPMDEEQARQAYTYRPYSKYSESRWGGNTLIDDVCLVINNEAHRCKMCQAPTKKKYLEDDVCPDCDGRAECNGYNPHQKV